MGETDSVSEYIELIVRKFESEKHDETELIMLTGKYGIKVNVFDLDEALLMVRKNYIVSVNLHLENFLNQITEKLKLGKHYKKKEDNESLLKNVCRNVFELSDTKSEKYLYYLICNYYRLVRNGSVHKEKYNIIRKAYEEVLEIKGDIIYKYPKLEVLKGIDIIKFDDFILYSKAAKELATVLENNIEFDYEKLASSINVTKFIKMKNSKERFEKSVRREINEKFSLTEVQVDCVIKIILKQIY